MDPGHVQLSASNDGHLFVPTGHLEYQGTVYNIEPGLCVDNGGTWIADQFPRGCDIPMETITYTDLSTAVVDSKAARDAPSELAAPGNTEHAHFVENLGILALILWALCLLMWVRDFFKSVKSKRRAQADWKILVRTSGMDVVREDVNDKGERVDGNRDKLMEEEHAVCRDSQSQLENV
ncbi:uncharacterized protein CC84DRAFT_1213189 [Paraphaeosphaeria sporulosa]|uniref:Uncharacterized protein n=1 Tax=Paraphaeosphaeria sporulosa TaxID=1460663 RepID=A0A177CQK3_9PLEO|nr:uncharacterized protein CC84DRAFT_1213189 [Paraphaeosphaeria sporulosa]OAG09803.1 hypothetical protein CC84DRAFT_1213189 [Paraphaeosphaeria sporulosa]